MFHLLELDLQQLSTLGHLMLWHQPLEQHFDYY